VPKVPKVKEFNIDELVKSPLNPLPWWPPARRAYGSERRGLRGGDVST